MTIKDFKEKEIPTLDFEIKKEGHLLIQCYSYNPNKSSSLILDGVEKSLTEIKNAFKVLKKGTNCKFEVGDIVSIADSFVDRPITGYKPPVGNDPNGEQRPIYGHILQGMFPFSFYCHKLEVEEEPLELTFLIPEDLITIKHNI